MTADFVWIPPQTAILGSDAHYAEEGPTREVGVDGFWMQTHQVTNA
ncbi:MAG: formylglycine-rating enzyme, partial [Mycobacterium sp.]|nr:formylglycine-rating enzyme [Mycobacterium sp.]